MSRPFAGYRLHEILARRVIAPGFEVRTGFTKGIPEALFVKRLFDRFVDLLPKNVFGHEDILAPTVFGNVDDFCVRDRLDFTLLVL